MDPVSNVDALVLLLRKRLEEKTRAAPPGRPGAAQQGHKAPSPADAAQALAGVAGVGDHQLSRALVQRLLADQFGPQAINDARFQSLVSRVTDSIEQEPQAALLLSRALRALRAAAAH